MHRLLLCCPLVLIITALSARLSPAADDSQSLHRLLAGTCADCHNDADPAGGVSFEVAVSNEALLARPDLIEKALNAIDSRFMPPDDAEPLSNDVRDASVAALTALLRTATATATPPQQPVSRLNRFHYNNTVRDLFGLDRDVFPLPEKLMTRHDGALRQALAAGGSGRLADVVQVSCDALAPKPGLAGVRAFPKDLRASHGFDNQADQLTLSPLLLDGFFHLSVSILESPDFTAERVGMWDHFFAAPPEGVDHREEVTKRLAAFLPRAFRRPITPDILDRYTTYTLAKLQAGHDFPTAMKKVAAAILSSPLFLYRAPPTSAAEEPFALADRLAFTLWGSCPDPQLLASAADGSLTAPAVLRTQVTRMLADSRIERFLDSFPSQWMQLENILAATPDPGLSRVYSLDPERPAGVQMVLEPLLLFEAAFVENRPLHELIAPPFSYRSAFLDAWYTSPLTPPAVDTAALPPDTDPAEAVAAAERAYDDHLRGLLRSTEFRRVANEDPRYGGILTNAAVLTMTSGPKRTHPVARGVWVIEVLFNAPPPPPPNDVPPLDEDAGDANLTIRERFAAHRENPSCAGCHSQLDPLGFALENFDITGRWRSHYANGRDVDAAGILMRQHAFEEAVSFKAALLAERRRLARGFTEHLLRFALARKLSPADRPAIEDILDATEADGFRLRDILQAVLTSARFQS